VLAEIYFHLPSVPGKINTAQPMGDIHE
jgi:hypothetical protein